MRIATLLPSATEIVCSLGLESSLVGVSHSCDHPPGVASLPRLTRTAVPVDATSAAIDAFVRRYLGGNAGLYQMDLEALAAVAPELLVSQRLCDVCAVSADEVQDVLCRLPGNPRLVDLDPACLDDVFADIQRVAEAAGVRARGERLVADLRGRVAAVRKRSAAIPPGERPRLAMLEWLDPPFDSGHWNPELVAAAGAMDVLSVAGRPSRTIRWEQVLAARPEFVLLSCCGFSIERTRDELRQLASHPGWRALRESVQGRILVMDGDAFLSRPGPRLVDALEALAHALHPALHPEPARGARVERIG